MARLGILVCIHPSLPSATSIDPDTFRMRDENGAGNSYRWSDYQKEGVFLIASPLNPFPGVDEHRSTTHISPMGLLYRSITQVGVGGEQPQAWMLEKSLGVDEILPMLTINGAYAAFAEDARGSLTAGKSADLVILSENPLEVESDRLKDINALITMVDGKVEFCAAGFESLCPSLPLDTSVSATPEPASNKPITASAELPGKPAPNAFDGDPATIWNSGGGPEQWIQIDLGESRMISIIRLTVAQHPEGETVHQIWGGDTDSNMQLLHEFRGHTSEFQVLEFTPSAPVENIRFIRVVTTQSPSWVAWREIEIR